MDAETRELLEVYCEEHCPYWDALNAYGKYVEMCAAAKTISFKKYCLKKAVDALKEELKKTLPGWLRKIIGGA